MVQFCTFLKVMLDTANTLLWLFWDIPRAEWKLKCSDYVVMTGMKHSSTDKTWGIRAVPGLCRWPKQAIHMGISPRTIAVVRRAVCIVWLTVISSFHRLTAQILYLFFGGCIINIIKKEKKRNGASSLSTIITAVRDTYKISLPFQPS